MRCARILLVWATLAGLVATGCQTVTGRTAGQWADDKATTARVKTALAATKISTLTRVDVDTVENTVYLRGKVESDDVKRRAEEAAKAVVGTARVANDLIVDSTMAQDRPHEAPPASPRTR